MLVQDKNAQITSVMNKIFTYLNSNLNLKKDLDDYYKATGISKDNKKVLNNYTINYIFERRLGKAKKTIFDFALSDMHDITDTEREIINSLKNSVDGIFEVRKITKDKFELFNLTNEKIYYVMPMAKMLKFRNLSVGHFLMARIIYIENNYYLYHVVDHITYTNRLLAFQIAVSRLAQNPSLFYYDNNEKFEELKESSANLFAKFTEMFKSQYVNTSNKKVDSLIELLNEYIETNKKPTKSKIEKFIVPCEKSSYFDIGELRGGSNLFAEAKRGFSGQNKEYNVALIADSTSGLHVIPFMDVFLNTFEEEYKNINNYKVCMKKFVTDKQIPPLVLQIANEKYPDKFLLRINEILETNFSSIDEIIHKYKSFYIENPYTSSTLTLYSSYAFKKLLAAIDEKGENPKNNIKVGRNDPCPCGSGLKYKKCCGMAVQI